jgi:large subunit ribosomal protein L5e
LHIYLTIFLADGLEEIYEQAHAKIRENPNLPADTAGKQSVEHWKTESLKFKQHKLNREQRRERVQQKIKELTA